jgi:hypothetical protein
MHCVLVLLLIAITTAYGGQIKWCKQGVRPDYDLEQGALCDESEMEVMLTFPVSFDFFSKGLCETMMRKIQTIRFQDIDNFFMTIPGKPDRASNAAYMTLKWALLNLPFDGDDMFLEFGTAGGFSINVTSVLRSKRFPEMKSTLHGFDWFKGLPEVWEDMHMKATTFAQPIPAVKDNVRLEVGLFNETLEPFLSTRRDRKVSFVNIDMDLYSGAVYVLQQLMPHFKRGSVIHFHEFARLAKGKVFGGGYNWNCVVMDEMRALYDIMQRNPDLDVQFMPYQAKQVFGMTVFRVLKT